MDKQLDDKVWMYVDGEMPKGQRMEFEKEIESNVELQEKVSFIKNLDQHLQEDQLPETPKVLAQNVMDEITTIEIYKQLDGTNLKSYSIYYIVGLFLLMLVSLFIGLALIPSSLLGEINLETSSDINPNHIKYVGYTGLMLIFSLVCYRISGIGREEF